MPCCLQYVVLRPEFGYDGEDRERGMEMEGGREPGSKEARKEQESEKNGGAETGERETHASVSE